MPAPRLLAAACRDPDVDPALFFPARGEPSEAAKTICARCPELDECREFALADRSLVGVWGGLSSLDRREERRRRRDLAREDGQPMADPAPIEFDGPSEEELTAIEAENDAPTAVGEASSSCSQCDRPALAGRPTCGSPECVDGHRRQRKRRNYARAAANGPPPRRRHRAPDLAEVATTANGANGNGSHLETVDSFGPVLGALAGVGATVVRLEVEVGSEHWTLIRSEGGT